LPREGKWEINTGYLAILRHFPNSLDVVVVVAFIVSKEDGQG